MFSARPNRGPPRQQKSGPSSRFIAFLSHCPPGLITPSAGYLYRRPVAARVRGRPSLPHRRSGDAIRVGRCRCTPFTPSTPRGRKKARITKIRAYRNYYCHAVLMALSLTGAAPGGSPIQYAQCKRPRAASHGALPRATHRLSVVADPRAAHRAVPARCWRCRHAGRRAASVA